MIRHARPEDRDTLYDICLRTGDGGADATAQYDDPDLLGHVYLGPYLALAPELAFVVTDQEDVPQGYCVGAADTASFHRACEERWWPTLRMQYPPDVPRRATDRGLVDMVHEPPATAPEIVDRFPGHLHIDLLPSMQGRGAGAALIERLLAALRETGCPGVHLGVAEGNARAIGFYRRVGFTDLRHLDGTVLMGMHLTDRGLTGSGPGPGSAREEPR